MYCKVPFMLLVVTQKYPLCTLYFLSESSGQTPMPLRVTDMVGTFWKVQKSSLAGCPFKTLLMSLMAVFWKFFCDGN